MRKAIVITSIFKPTEAIKRFSRLDGWTTIVVGDKKTPKNWRWENTVYISDAEQKRQPYRIVKELPWNHYSRKMVGYLYAIERGAKIIYDTDDDNIPLRCWREPVFMGDFKTVGGRRYVNIYKYFTARRIWPRGLPLTEILNEQRAVVCRERNIIRIWQHLANGDPDVDAIYRLIDNRRVIFMKNEDLVLAKGSICPINSQNTFFHHDVFPLLYLPAYVNFRFTDILRGLVAQPILWKNDWRVGFGGATVVQKRNVHDYMKDFESEIPVYMYADRVSEVARSIARRENNMGKSLRAIYEGLLKAGVIEKTELRLLEAWLYDVSVAIGVAATKGVNW